MTWEGSFEVETESAQSWTETAVSVVEPGGLSAMGALAQSQGYLWVALRAPGPQHRGRLGLYIEECIEQELEDRGALPPGIQASTGLDASLSDQLYRARLVEMRGITLGIPSLEGITNLGRTLDAEDSGVLRWWMAATAERPVRMVLSAENMRLRVYPSPVLFETLFDVAPEPLSPRVPSVAMAESAGSMDLSDLPPRVASDDDDDDQGDEPVSFAEEPSTDEFEESVSAHSPLSSWASDVELAELDRALGLTTDEPVTHRDAAAPAPESTNSEWGAAEATSAAVAAEVSTMDEPASEEPVTTEFVRSPTGPQVALPLFTAPSTTPSAVTSNAGTSSVALDESSAPESEDRNSRKTLESARPPSARGRMSADDGLDPEEFLRVLEGDSARLPRVDAERARAETAAVATTSNEVVAAAPSREEMIQPTDDVLSAVPSPLPTKVIRRAPFIRLAEEANDEVEAESDTSPDVAEEEVASIEAISEAPMQVRAPKPQPARPVIDENDPFFALAQKEWKTWVKNLDAARGPKPLAVVERMFVTDYTRLREAVRRGIADVSANEVLDAWQESFATSYSEAFDALRVRGKRPTMVLDVPELAQRLGRLQGARRVQLLLVDGLRFDLGLMVQERMRAQADAALTERLLLWSALPTITTYQLELLGKGAEGLKESCSTDESPALVARGRSALTPRRIRTGRLELFKIDVVEDALREAGEPMHERLPDIASRTAHAICEHLSKQAPRTLVVVFGDHGFLLDPSQAGTTAEVRQGGASPEEVLVPAFAWLTGAVH